MASPKRTPTALAKLGPDTSKGKRKTNANEPKPKASDVTPPEWLDDRARVIWSEIAPEAVRIGLLSVADRNAFARYCVNAAEWLVCYQFIREHGGDLITKDADGKPTGITPTPYPKRMRELDALLLRFEQEFGFTPSSRTKINVTPEAPADPMDEFEDGPPMRLAQ